MFSVVNFAARKGLAANSSSDDSLLESNIAPKSLARRTGIRGETYAYWYLRRCGYTLIARNYTSPGMKGEIDMVGYDGSVLAFIEVKTRSIPSIAPRDTATPNQPAPEDAVNSEKRRNLARMAQQFLRARRIESPTYRFDILAIESAEGRRPNVRLSKGAFIPPRNSPYAR
jgi:putative endonuclease